MTYAVSAVQDTCTAISVVRIAGAGLLLANIYASDSYSLLEKVGLTAASALAVSIDMWMPCLAHQARLRWLRFVCLERWKTHLSTFTNDKKVKDLAFVDKKYSDFENDRFETGKHKWGTAEEHRGLVVSSAANLVTDIFSKHVIKRSKILEIGSNELNSQGLSHLARLLPNDYRINLAYSDYVQKVVDAEVRNTSKRYRCVDIRNPPLDLFESQDCLAAINVADVIGYDDLSKMAAGASKLVKSKGTVIFLADRPLESYALYDRFSKPDQFVFPWTVSSLGVDDLDRGVKVIAVDALRRIIGQWGEEYRAFFEKMIALTPLQRRYFFVNAFFSKTKLCEFLQYLTDDICASYDRVALYEESVTSAFESHGFTTVQSGYLEKSTFVNSNDLFYQTASGMPHNTITYDPRTGGVCVCTVTAGVPRGKTKVNAAFHALVFKKIS